MSKLPAILTDKPSFLSSNFGGYFHHQDSTTLPFNSLTFPSQNCYIPFNDKVVPDKGKQLLGQAFTENSGIIGNREKFKNLGGIEMEVRTWRSSVGQERDVIEILYNNAWHRITETVNPLPLALHEYYFDEWYDTKLLNNVPNSDPSKNLPRLVWVNGNSSVYSWTGGVAEITNVVVNTSISIDSSTTWRSLGFTEDANGDVFVVVNGVSYQATTPADINTSTIALTSTTGISMGDIATSKIEVDSSPIPFDFCRANKNYMFYGSWKQRDLYMSNNFNREYNYRVTSFQALQNDLVLDLSTPYTGTMESTYKVIIQETNPNVTIQTYLGQGLNDARFNDTGYTALGNTKNVYKVVVVADFSLLVNGTGSFNIGETVTGGTSSAVARVVHIIANGPNWSIACEMLSSTPFVQGETITGSASTTTGVIQAGNGAFYQNWIQYFKNDVLTSITSSSITGTTVPIFTTLTVTLTDGLTIDFGNYTGHKLGDFWELDIRRGGEDKFVWQKDGGTVSAPISITGGLQTLSDGVSITFTNRNGHAVGDFWIITAFPKVDRAWANFYYALPVRAPGEGYIYRLPSNFWTMNTQEEAMYVNTSYGEWSIVTTTLSSDLLSEDVSLTPLKQASAIKVLYPYLTGHMDNDLVFITIDKDLNTIGRLQLVEKPQVAYLSDFVKLDFEASSFVGGSIKFLNNKLFISSPEQGITHCFDATRKYWQPPKVFPEVGLLSIVGNTLICHSNTRNQSFTMFAGGGNGDNGLNYDVIIRTPYTALDDRWNLKNSSMTFTEGYIEGLPRLEHTVYLGVDGCQGEYSHIIEPFICTPPTRAPFGQGPFGSHPFGSDSGNIGSHFMELYKDYAPIMEYYFIAFQIKCTALNHSYQIVSMGANGIFATKGNNQLINRTSQLLQN